MYQTTLRFLTLSIAVNLSQINQACSPYHYRITTPKTPKLPYPRAPRCLQHALLKVTVSRGGPGSKTVTPPPYTHQRAPRYRPGTGWREAIAWRRRRPSSRSGTWPTPSSLSCPGRRSPAIMGYLKPRNHLKSPLYFTPTIETCNKKLFNFI